MEGEADPRNLRLLQVNFKLNNIVQIFGSFEPIFDSRLGGQYRQQYMAPQALKSKSGQNNPKTRAFPHFVDTL